jgi:hypothetical protein
LNGDASFALTAKSRGEEASPSGSPGPETSLKEARELGQEQFGAVVGGRTQGDGGNQREDKSEDGGDGKCASTHAAPFDR